MGVGVNLKNDDRQGARIRMVEWRLQPMREQAETSVEDALAARVDLSELMLIVVSGLLLWRALLREGWLPAPPSRVAGFAEGRSRRSETLA